MIKLYSNENFPLEVVHQLRTLGYDVLTTLDAGKAGSRIPDNEVLDFAIQETRAVITLNRKDFRKLHLLQPEHFGIIICTENPDFEEMALEINRILQSTSDNIAGELVKIYKPND